MSSPYRRPGGQPKIVVRETDDYRTRREEAPEPQEPGNPWIRNVFQPLVIATLVGCIAYSIAQVLSQIVTGTPPLIYWAVPVMMAAIGFRTQRIVQKRFLASSDITRFRVIELVVLFIVVKWLSLFDNTPAEILAAIRGWTQAPLTFFDAETMIAYLLGLLGWLAAGATARDIDAVKDPTMYIGETGPHSRLATRYFIGAGALLFFAAIARVNLRGLLTGANTRVRMPIVNALIYFLLGLVLLGQIRFARLQGLWKREKVTVTSKLNSTWLRFTLLFLALVALIAFILPTNYTLGLLDLVSLLIRAIVYLVSLLYALILWPIAMLLSLFKGQRDSGQGTAKPPPFTPPELAPAAGGSHPWWAIVRSILFWVVLLTVMILAVRSYIRDRPGLRAALRRFAPWRWLESALDTVWQWLRGVGRRVGAAVPAVVQRLRQLGSRQRILRRERTRGPEPREQLFYHYLKTLDHAKERGLPRHGSQTPREYRRTVEAHVPEADPAMDALTEAFVEARYSTHPVTPEEVAAQEANATRVENALDAHAAEERRRQQEGPRR